MRERVSERTNGDLFVWVIKEDESVQLHVVIEIDSRETGDNRALKLTQDGGLSLYRYDPTVSRVKLCYDKWHNTGRDDVILWKYHGDREDD